MRVDTNGNAWYDILAWIGVGLFAVALTVVTLRIAGIAIGGIAGGIIMGAAIGSLALGTVGAAFAGASLTGANNLMLWIGLWKDGATIAAQEAGKMGLKTIGQTFGGKVISMFPEAFSSKMWIWDSKLAVSTTSMSSIIVLTGETIYKKSVYSSYEWPILIKRGIEIIRIIFGG